MANASFGATIFAAAATTIRLTFEATIDATAHKKYGCTHDGNDDDSFHDFPQKTRVCLAKNIFLKLNVKFNNLCECLKAGVVVSKLRLIDMCSENLQTKLDR